MAEQGARYTPSVYLSVTDDANRWRGGPPQPQQLKDQSKINMLMNTGQGLAIEKNLSKYDVKVLAAETRKQSWIKELGIGPKTTYVVYIIRVSRIKDGASCVSAQRYSELRSLYNHLKHEGQVRSEGAPEFPGKRMVSEESFTGDRSDANGEFVKARKEKLSSFLRKLFNKNPAELWDHPDVREFFNLGALDQGKSYAERAHASAAAAAGGNGIGHGLRNYDPSNPSQWNPYSIAMQAAQQNRTRNTDFIHNTNNALDEEGRGDFNGDPGGGVGGSGSCEGGRGEPGGGAGARAEGDGVCGGERRGRRRSVGWVSRQARTRRLLCFWGSAAAVAVGFLSVRVVFPRVRNALGAEIWPVSQTMTLPPPRTHVRIADEFETRADDARLALRASGYDTNLAAEYCVTGIPPGRAASVSNTNHGAPTPSSTSRGRGRKGVIGNNLAPSGGGAGGGGSGGSGSPPPWMKPATTAAGRPPSGASMGGYAGGGGAVASPPADRPMMTSGAGSAAGGSSGLDWRNMPRPNDGGGINGGGGRGRAGSALSGGIGSGGGGGGGGIVDV
ncbi:unnamed protein product [Scytosiphon promiscuus]